MLDDLFRPGTPDSPGKDEEMVALDPLLERRLDRQPWRIRSAQWRAWTLAEAAFGEGVTTHLAGKAGFDVFRGLLTLRVPFRDLQDHRHRETLFLSWAERDPILTRIPFIFIFQPDPVTVADEP
jgi:hypothetical protein